ncbi:very short patch repair endonuclease [Pseudomonas taiwanensis]|uniref:very short patch repair endonuclease n=1 Tax=Pseudomonas taiwanensis TaxID=470150 RepID=UPI0015BF2040|nr:very short patch repair endonuclease [Pseudomonas taiwanensis]NWL80419.1 very short patch repair endonuclease [Pseudomonas taiwanensis]
MVDVLTSEQRQLNMSRIRGRDTKPEMLIRRGLHARGLRYRLHVKTLPGRPDLVFPRFRTVVFVHGCFWHAHGCNLSKEPTTRKEFWTSKLEGNAIRDRITLDALQALGWRILIIWECALRGPSRIEYSNVLDRSTYFIREDEKVTLEISGQKIKPTPKITQ